MKRISIAAARPLPRKAASMAGFFVMTGLLGFGAIACEHGYAAQHTKFVQHDPVEDRRAAYTAKIDAWLTRQWGGGAQYSGDVLTLIEGGANVRDETALACVVAQLQVPPPPYFRQIRIVEVTHARRTHQFIVANQTTDSHQLRVASTGILRLIVSESLPSEAR